MRRFGLAIFWVFFVMLCCLPIRLLVAFEISEIRSKSGISAWLIEDHKNPIVTIQVTFMGGASIDPKDKAGLAYLASGLLDEGAGHLDSKNFQKRLEHNSILMTSNARLDSFSITVKTLTETSKEAFELLKLAISAPRFDEESLNRVRGQAIANLNRVRESPNWIANRVWWESAFEGHPYSRSVKGTISTLSNITREDLKRFAAQNLSRKRLFIGVVGDITAKKLAVVLEQIFGSLMNNTKNEIVMPVKNLKALGQTMVVEREIPQSTIAFGHEGIQRDDPDWYISTILFEILSGGFGSRLTKEIRENRGLTYGIYAYPIPLAHTGIIVGQVSTANKNVTEVMKSIKEIWRRFGESGPTAPEVIDAKAYLKGSYPLQFTDSSKMASLLTALQRFGLGKDYLARRSKIISSISMFDLKRVSKRLFKAADLSFVIVGKPMGAINSDNAPKLYR